MMRVFFEVEDDDVAASLDAVITALGYECTRVCVELTEQVDHHLAKLDRRLLGGEQVALRAMVRTDTTAEAATLMGCSRDRATWLEVNVLHKLGASGRLELLRRLVTGEHPAPPTIDHGAPACAQTDGCACSFCTPQRRTA